MGGTIRHGVDVATPSILRRIRATEPAEGTTDDSMVGPSPEPAPAQPASGTEADASMSAAEAPPSEPQWWHDSH
eukprot:3238322-Lingulodinium_polyedra.AAC.1